MWEGVRYRKGGSGKWVLEWEGRRAEWVSSYDGCLLRGTVGVVCSFGRDRWGLRGVDALAFGGWRE